MGDVWFTADTHFGHRAMSREGWRPFDTVAEHDEFLIEQWNAHVKRDDMIYHLGDVGIGNDEHTFSCVKRLAGEKHLIPGNHDACWPGHRDAHRHQKTWMRFFESVQAFARRRNGTAQLYRLSHFPYANSGDHTETERYRPYRLHNDGEWLLHGHVHAAWKQRGRMINVGVDAWNWRPVNLDEVRAMLAAGPVNLEVPGG